MNAKKKPSKGSFKNSIIKNTLLIIALGVSIILATLVFLHLYTRQNKSVKVPDVKGKELELAITQLKKNGLDFVVIDSIYDYNNNSTPNSVIEQVPQEGSTTKEGRQVFLTIYAKNPPQVSMPALADYSLRQARALLVSMGFEKITIEKVPSEHNDLVEGIKYRGKKLQPEEKIPAGSPLTIIVGSKSLQDLQDIDNEYSSVRDDNNQKSETNSPIVDESFF